MTDPNSEDDLPIHGFDEDLNISGAAPPEEPGNRRLTRRERLIKGIPRPKIEVHSTKRPKSTKPQAKLQTVVEGVAVEDSVFESEEAESFEEAQEHLDSVLTVDRNDLTFTYPPRQNRQDSLRPVSSQAEPFVSPLPSTSQISDEETESRQRLSEEILRIINSPLISESEDSPEKPEKMPDETRRTAAQYSRVLKEAEMIIEDDIDPIVVKDCTDDHLKQKGDLAEALKVKVRSAALHIEELDPTAFATIEVQVHRLRKRLKEFVTMVQAELQGRKQADAEVTKQLEGAAVKALQIKKTAVATFGKSIVDEMNKAAQQMDLLAIRNPSSDAEFRELESSFNVQVKKAEDAHKEASQLFEGAVDAGLEREAMTIQEAMRTLKQKHRAAEESVSKNKLTFNISTGGSRHSSDMSPPTFSGDSKEDYYMFAKEFEEYSVAKGCSRDELLRILLTKCLKNDAKIACQFMKTKDEVFEYLKETYGNPRLLLNKQVEEVKKLGKCDNFNEEKRRGWALAMKAKLEYTHQLAETHKLLSELYHSGIIEAVQSQLPWRLQDELITLMEEESEGELIPRKDLFDYLVKFIGTVCKRATFKINNGLANAARDEKSGAGKGNQAGSKQANQKKNFHNSERSEERDSNQESSSEKEKSKKSSKKKGEKKKPEKKSYVASTGAPVQCKICKNEQNTHAFYCKKFQETPVSDRYKLVGLSRVCMRCLRSDTEVDFKERKAWWSKHKEDCVTDWVCKVEDCKDKWPARQCHFLICSDHETENKAKEQDFIKTLDKKQLGKDFKFFYNVPSFVNWNMNIKETAGKPVKGWEVLPDVVDPSIFMLQHVLVDGHKLLVFYDSGCLTASISQRAAEILDAEEIRPGPTVLNVAGGETVDIPGGDVRFTLPLADGKHRATITALCMPEVTSTFPEWELQEAADDLKAEYQMKSGKGAKLSDVPDMIGGQDVDIMIGIQYKRWFPTLEFESETGLCMSRSKFLCPEGKRGILAGPHKSWRDIQDAAHLVRRVYEAQTDFFNQNNDLIPGNLIAEDRLIKDEVVQCQHKHCESHTGQDYKIPLTWEVGVYTGRIKSIKEELKEFSEIEEIGSENSYRCPACRSCVQCKKAETIEMISLKEEKEQFLINQSLEYDEDRRKIIAKLPFIHDPIENLKPNHHIAYKIFQSQERLLEKDDKMRQDVVKSHQKLVDKGFVCKVSDLSEEMQNKLEGCAGGYMIPWRTVSKANSLSTPVRMVFDASSATPDGLSLNQTLAKGQNTLNNLFNILLRFRLKKYGFSADVSMAYNQVELDPEFVQYQKYYWKDEMLMNKKLEVWVILTLIYGVCSSGNLTIGAFKKLASLGRDEPQMAKGAEVLESDAYMDDVISGQDSAEELEESANQLKKVLELGSMGVKDITFSGRKPSDLVSADDEHVGLLGMLWKPETDEVKLDIKDLYLGKMKRGRMPEVITGDLESALRPKFTRRTLASKVAGVFDPLGLATPFTARLKLQLHDVCEMKTDWDDLLPEANLKQWVESIYRIQDLKHIYFKRSVIPENAETAQIDLIVSCDASKEIGICTVHSRIKLKDGGYSVQLLCAKSKLVSNLTIPRAELKAMVVGATLSFCTRKAAGSKLRDVMYVTDSAICLYWLQQDQRPLQTAVRNGVIEIKRLTDESSWFHIDSSNNVADIGTRSEVEVDIGKDSEWMNGKDWMRMEKEDMPTRTLQQVSLNCDEKREASKEIKAADIGGIVLTNLKSKVADRYSFSKYVLDPNKFSWPKVIRIMAYCLRFIYKLKKGNWEKPWFPNQSLPSLQETKPPVTVQAGKEKLSVELPRLVELGRAESYYYYKATQEVRQFTKAKEWKNHTIQDNSILLYDGRLVEGQEVANQLGAGLDLEPLMFIRPVADRYSPVSYSVMLYSHSVLGRHRNVSATLRESRTIMFIFGGRDLAAEIREACPFCRRFKKETLQRKMGPVHENRLVIAPPFYYSQVDLFGPLNAICEHQHRSSVKVWGVVFKDPSTGAISVHCMPKYDTVTFIMAYTRFAARYGHPAKLFIDAGTQLLSAVKNMEISRIDLIEKLTVEHDVGIEFEVCPVGQHNPNGVVERSIKEVKKLFNQMYSSLKLDIMAYETAFQWISSELNNFPIALGSKTSNLDNLDLLTPSRLILGRNNRRALSGQVKVEVPSRLVKQNSEVEEAWWKVWSTEKLQEFIPRSSKWSKSSDPVDVGDIVVFLKTAKESVLGEPVWRLGRVMTAEPDKDGIVRKVEVQYRNDGEKVFRTVTKSVRQLCVLHHEGDLELVDILNEASKQSTISFLIKNK